MGNSRISFLQLTTTKDVVLFIIIGSNACCVIAGEVGSARCGQRISIGKKRDAYPIYAHDVSLLHICFVCKVYHASYMCALECAQCTCNMCIQNLYVRCICMH
jgi:hypothetical protein